MLRFGSRFFNDAGDEDVSGFLLDWDEGDVRPDEIVRVAEGKKNGRSYIFGDNDTAQELVDNYSGNGINCHKFKKFQFVTVKIDSMYC